MERQSRQQLLLERTDDALIDVRCMYPGQFEETTDNGVCSNCDCGMDIHYDAYGNQSYHCDNCGPGISFYDSEDS